MGVLFTDVARFDAWLEVEVLAVEAWAAIGVVAPAVAEAVRVKRPIVDAAFVAAIDERERVMAYEMKFIPEPIEFFRLRFVQHQSRELVILAIKKGGLVIAGVGAEGAGAGVS